jgi:hypothetical protein
VLIAICEASCVRRASGRLRHAMHGYGATTELSPEKVHVSQALRSTITLAHVSTLLAPSKPSQRYKEKNMCEARSNRLMFGRSEAFLRQPVLCSCAN